MNEHERRARADRLGAVREDIAAVLDEMDARYVDIWRKAEAADKREDAHRMVRLLADFKTQLSRIAFDGATADETIKAQEKRRNWIPGF